MTEKAQTELIIEILDQSQEWGRSEYIDAARSEGREIHVLLLANSTPPTNNSNGTWLNIKGISEVVSEKIRGLYPRFLYETAKDTGLLDITVLDKVVSLYWLMPISEMSVLRNPLIDKLYALLVLKEVLKNSDYQRILLVNDDELLETPISEICSHFNKKIEIKRIRPIKHSYYKSTPSLVVSWWLQSINALMYGLFFRLLNIGKPQKQTLGNVLGLTIFPTLWSEVKEGDLENLAFGDFPAELKKHGSALQYLAIPTIRLRDVIRRMKHWRKYTRENHIVFTHAVVSFHELVSIFVRRNWGRELSRWFKKLSIASLQIDSIDITQLVAREFQHELWGQGLFQSLTLAYASTNMIQKTKSISSALCAFESQPIEKAFVAGIKKANPNIVTIGLQTSLIGKSHLGYYILPEQTHTANQLVSPFAPLPDYVASYGKTTYNMLLKIFGSERVNLSGPIRYPYLKIDSQTERDNAEKMMRDRFSLNGETVFALLALPSLKEEAHSIMDWSMAIAEKYPQLYFLIRFHYWAVLTNELKEISRSHSFTRYQIVDGNLHELLLASRFMITGTSSVGIEAMVSGCMPISYKPTRRYDFGRIQDVEEGAFLYTNPMELQYAVNECVLQSQTFLQKKLYWQENIQKLCTPLDGKASSRFYSWLTNQNVQL